MKKNRKLKYLCFLNILLFTLAPIAPSFCSEQASDKPNIIIIVLDALRPDHLSCYGYPRNTSPNIDKLAKEGTLFTQAISAAGWTAESVPSILTGTYPYTHQVRDWNLPLNPSIITIQSILRSKGYSTLLFSNHGGIRLLPHEGFDTVKHYPLNTNEHRLNKSIAEWLQENKEKNFFVYLHYHEPHVPYVAPEEYKNKFLKDKYRIKKERPISGNKSQWGRYAGKGKIPYIIAENGITDVSYYIALYDGAISYADTQVGHLIKKLQDLELLDNTLIFVTADHGEMLGDHGQYFNHGTCWESVIRVPLIIRFPKIFPQNKTISQLTSLIDIVPTILEIAGIDSPSYIEGKSLLSLLHNENHSLHSYVYSSAHKMASIRSLEWKLLWTHYRFFILPFNFYRLYDLIEDPQEEYNAARRNKVKFKEFIKILERYKTKDIFDKKKLSEEQKGILKSLGYAQ